MVVCMALMKYFSLRYQDYAKHPSKLVAICGCLPAWFVCLLLAIHACQSLSTKYNNNIGVCLVEACANEEYNTSH